MTPTQEAQELLRTQLDESGRAYERLMECLDEVGPEVAAQVVAAYVGELLDTRPYTGQVDDQVAMAIRLIESSSRAVAVQLYTKRLITIRSGYKGTDFNSRVSKALSAAMKLYAESDEWSVGRAHCVSVMAKLEADSKNCDRAHVHGLLEQARLHLEELQDLEARKELRYHLERSRTIYLSWITRWYHWQYRKPLGKVEQRLQELPFS